MFIKIFGGSGFIGSHLVKRLASLGHNVTVFDQKKSKFTTANVNSPAGETPSWINPIRFIGGDISKYQDVYYAIDKGDFVVNLAAIAQFEIAENNPHLATSVNVSGASNVLQACIENKAAHLIYASTGSVYSPDAQIPIDENQNTEPNSVYGMTKLWAEKIQTHCADKLPIAILRLPHVVGGGKTWGANTIIAKLIENERPTIFGDGTTKNDFTHVDDIVQAIELTLKEQAKGIFNIGSGESRSTLEFFEWSRRLLDKNNIEPIYSSPRNVDFPIFEYDITKAKEILGYKPKYNFEKTLEKTIQEWDQWL